jgi:4-hydroxybenzoate polyprenyltransferase
LVGCAALGVNSWELVLDDTNNGTALGCLFISYVLWQIVHDSICAHQDVLNDEKSGIGSMADRHREKINLILSRPGQMSAAILALTGFLIDAGLVYYVGAAAGTWVWLRFMMRKADLKDPIAVHSGSSMEACLLVV